LVTSPISISELFHTGIVVDDVDAAQAELSDVLGVAWGPEGEMEQAVWLQDGPRTIAFRFAYTTEGPHHLELVRRVPDTLWTVAGAGHAHHLGYWCADVPGASDELARRGLPLVAKVGVDDADAPAQIVYHQAKSGMYVELIDTSVRPLLFGGDA
jgi:hypothetical protein